MPENKSYKRLEWTNRLGIERGLNTGKSFRQIAAEENCSPSTVSREVVRNRVPDKSRRYGEGVHRFCANDRNCSVRGLCQNGCGRLCRICRQVLCTEHCRYFEKACCDRLVMSPFVCNGCDKKRGCSVKRFIYDARQAESLARTRQSESRRGFDIDHAEIEEVAHLIVPLIKAGQSIGQIYLNHKEDLHFSERTLRTYIHAGVFADLSDFDLNRKVRYRPRKKRSVALPRDIPRHSFSDFSALNAEEQGRATELDTVIGRVGGKTLLTLHMRTTSFMLMILMEKCTSGDVIAAFGLLDAGLCAAELDFVTLFPILLPDRGSEFARWELLETLGQDTDDSDIHTRLFFCDPASPHQRGAQEKNHEYIREILPKGTSFDDLTQKDINLIASHVNSIPRASLGGKTPYELTRFLYGQRWLKTMGVYCIAPDEVIRKPWLLEVNRTKND